ncbi:hypothetical protein JCM16161A_22160 [Vulcanisaeta sp. JCM 16161]
MHYMPYVISFIRALLRSLPQVIRFGDDLWLRARLIEPLITYGLIKHPVMALPLGVKVFINNLDTLSINIPDMFERMEYSLHRDFIPARGDVVVDAGAYIGIYSLWA